MKVRPAIVTDAQGMSAVLTEILIGKRSGRASDPEHIRDFYIEHSDRIQCAVAVDDNGTILGFQSLKVAAEGNIYDVPLGWGVIGTYVRLEVGRQGIGSALFVETTLAARQAGISKIDATIGSDNDLGLGYYDAMGFRAYREKPSAICKCYTVADHTD